MSPDTCGQDNSTASSHVSLHHGHNLIDFDVRYGRKTDVNATSCYDSALSHIRGMSCQQVLNFIERHVPVVTLIRTYKVGRRLTINLLFAQHHRVLFMIPVQLSTA